METKIKSTGGTAFSVPQSARWEGMTLRDYFAAKVANGIMANPYSYKHPTQVATEAYSIADAMLEERDK